MYKKANIIRNPFSYNLSTHLDILIIIIYTFMLYNLTWTWGKSRSVNQTVSENEKIMKSLNCMAKEIYNFRSLSNSNFHGTSAITKKQR